MAVVDDLGVPIIEAPNRYPVVLLWHVQVNCVLLWLLDAAGDHAWVHLA